MKTSAIGGSDPYLMPDNIFKEISFQNLAQVAKTDLPDFSNGDLFYYLIHQHSHYSNEEFKSYKSLESYNQLQQGWLTKFRVWKSQDENMFLVMSKVGIWLINSVFY